MSGLAQSHSAEQADTTTALFRLAQHTQLTSLDDCMNEIALNNIAAYLMEKSRLSFTGHKRAVLRSRLETRLTELHLPDLSAYWVYLKNNPAEASRLFDLVTTNETSYFRNPAQFAFLHDWIIPGYEQLPAAEKSSIRILCAGCSTGEEPYSVAMTLLSSIRYPEKWRLEVIAGDLSESCLKTAREGYYEHDKLTRLPAGYRERFMENKADGAVVRDEVKKLVRFEPFNLNDVMGADPAANERFGKFDIIFCRNVMIYFASACQQLLVETLYRLLLPGGYLFTGDAEPLHLFRHEFKPVAYADCLIYQRTEASIDARTVQ